MELEELIMIAAASIAHPSKHRDWFTTEDLERAVDDARALWKVVLKKEE